MSDHIETCPCGKKMSVKEGYNRTYCWVCIFRAEEWSVTREEAAKRRKLESQTNNGEA